jgi:hypothetical protein
VKIFCSLFVGVWAVIAGSGDEASMNREGFGMATGVVAEE